MKNSLNPDSEFLKRITNVAPVILYIYDLETNQTIWASNELTKMLGFSIEEIQEMGSQVLPKLMHPDDFANYSDYYTKLRTLKEGDVAEFEYRMRHADSSWRWFRSRDMAFSRLSSGEVEWIAGAASDISEDKRIERELTKKTEGLRLALEAGKLGIWYLDMDTNLITLNSKNAELLGLSSSETEITLEKFRSLVHPDDVEELSRGGDEAALNGDYQAQYRILLPDGRVRWLGSRGQFVTNGLRQVAVHGVNWDITAQKETEIALQRSREIAEEANKMKSEFLANVSHEIRTPMSSILGYSDLISRHIDDQKALKWLGIVRANGEHLLSILDDILDISKIEANKLALEEKEVSLSQILTEVNSLMAIRAREKDLSFGIFQSLPLPRRIVTDAKRLRQILLNLLGNAIKFTERGFVRMSVSFDKASDQLFFCITDSGIGISTQVLENLFQRFSQGDGSFSRSHGGTGLGLAISQRLASMLGGEISVTSTVNEGSTFCLRVKANAGENPKYLVDKEIKLKHKVRARRSPQTDLSGLRVLIVEDAPLIRDYLALVIRESGGEVIAVSNGILALSHLATYTEANPIDIVLLDMQMPILDGYETARQMRAAGLSVPILALTAHAMQGVREDCIEAGCTSYLSKPVDSEEITAEIGRLCSNKRDEGATEKDLRSILLVDDDVDLLRLHALELEELGFRVFQAPNEKEALRYFKDKTIHLDGVMLDLKLGASDGLNLFKQVRSQNLQVEDELPVFFAVTGLSSPRAEKEVLDSGFAGYFVKPVNMRSIVKEFEARWSL